MYRRVFSLRKENSQERLSAPREQRAGVQWIKKVEAPDPENEEEPAENGTSNENKRKKKRKNEILAKGCYVRKNEEKRQKRY